MSDASAKPVIFISYSHKDEPENPAHGEVQWLSFVRTYLQPAAKYGIFDLWVDRHMPGGADWDAEIERKVRECDIFILLVSANSMASDYIVDREIAIVRERQARCEPVHFYPLLLTPTPDAGLQKVNDKNLRPRDARPFSSFSVDERLQHMTEAANEIARIANQISERKGPFRSNGPRVQPDYVHITGLPETAYERLVGRDAELKRLDDAWANSKINILSLIADGGAGKSALVNEWLKQLQAENYRGAEAVLGWSFYNQGTKERASSANEFLNWALKKLSIKLETTDAIVKAEAIARAMMRGRVLLLLDGVEPLQHGLDTQVGQLKDSGLDGLLRRFAASGEAHGLIVLTSRLAVKNIARWKDGAAPVVPVERLSEEAGAALLRDNGVWGTDQKLKTAAYDFGGYPLALGLLASLLRETRFGDIRQRFRIRKLLSDPDNPGRAHAWRVMESYDKEWLAPQPLLLAIMQIVGLFDRPANADALRAFRMSPRIDGLTDGIVKCTDSEWNRAVYRLREARLLAPAYMRAPYGLDTHPLVREWFGERLKSTHPAAFRAANFRLFEHFRVKNLPQPLWSKEAYGLLSLLAAFPRAKDNLNDIIKSRQWPALWLRHLPPSLLTADWDKLEVAVARIGTPSFEQDLVAFLPKTLESMTSLLACITHGCAAGRHDDAFYDVYLPRVRRGDDAFLVKKLGALDADLAVLSNFVEPESRNPIASVVSLK